LKTIALKNVSQDLGIVGVWVGGISCQQCNETVESITGEEILAWPSNCTTALQHVLCFMDVFGQVRRVWEQNTEINKCIF
jgi:ABC-type antimicrobial peptide transport system ATPase subunit